MTITSVAEQDTATERIPHVNLHANCRWHCKNGENLISSDCYDRRCYSYYSYYDYIFTTTTTDGAAAHLSQKLCAKKAVMERTAPNGSCGGRAKEVLTM